MDARTQKEQELRELEMRMNEIFGELAQLDQENPQPEQELLLEDDKEYDKENDNGLDLEKDDEMSETAEHSEEEFMEEEEDELQKLWGINPSRESTEEIKISEKLATSIKAWITKGVENKEEKEKRLKAISRKGQINLDALVLNEEITIDLHLKACNVRAIYKYRYHDPTSTTLVMRNQLRLICRFPPIGNTNTPSRQTLDIE